MVKKNGVMDENREEAGGLKQRGDGDIYEDDGALVKNAIVREHDYTKELPLSMNLLCSSNGHFTTWGDVTTAELGPDGVMAA